MTHADLAMKYRLLMTQESVKAPLDQIQSSLRRAVQHAKWMTEELISESWKGGYDKRTRWISFIQGVLWSAGFLTIDECREDITELVSFDK